MPVCPHHPMQPAATGAPVPADVLAATPLSGAAAVAVVVDGALRPELSTGIGDLAARGVYVGALGGAPAAVQAKLVRF